MSEEWSGPPKDVGVYRGVMFAVVILVALSVAVWIVGRLAAIW